MMMQIRSASMSCFTICGNHAAQPHTASWKMTSHRPLFTEPVAETLFCHYFNFDQTQMTSSAVCVVMPLPDWIFETKDFALRKHEEKANVALFLGGECAVTWKCVSVNKKTFFSQPRICDESVICSSPQQGHAMKMKNKWCCCASFQKSKLFIFFNHHVKPKISPHWPHRRVFKIDKELPESDVQTQGCSHLLHVKILIFMFWMSRETSWQTIFSLLWPDALSKTNENVSIPTSVLSVLALA